MPLEDRTIAIVEDDPIMGESLAQSLSLEGYKVNWLKSAAEAEEWLCGHRTDLVVCDIRLPDGNGDELFGKLQQCGCGCPPVLFMTAYGEIDQAVALIRAGANDYVTKPFDMDRFLAKVRSVVERRPLFGDPPILGVSPAMHDVEELLHRVARLNSPILITGETGAGKDVCARLLHRLSRADSPFVAVNCAAIPGELLESEIFGHEAGAFTSAAKRHLGYAERAGEGILFLDEIGALPLPLQAKLLRLIEAASFYRLGGERSVPFRARLVAATNADLGDMVASGAFREDLYYRINVVEVAVPPLRERPKDIRWLMDAFFLEFASAQDRAPRGVSSLAEAAALAHSWPGNVRELRNRVERAVALALGDWIMPADLFPERRGEQPSAGPTLAATRDSAEMHRIEKALAENDGKILRTATALGISRTTLWEKMRKFGLT